MRVGVAWVVWALLPPVAVAEEPGLAADTGPPAASAPLDAGDPAALELARSVAQLPLPARIAAISASFKGAPYVNDPLGEGRAPDSDPLVRHDAFDCLTYVEEVLALSLAADPASVGAVRLDLRYGGRPVAYENRHHLMEVQWLPNAVARGWLRDTAAEYGPVHVLERDVTLATWRAWSRRPRFAMTDEQLPVGPMRLEYLSLEDAIAAAPRIRPGSVVLAVREDRAHIPVWITHLGFVVEGDQPTFRHASSMRSAMQVRDNPLVSYLQHLAGYQNWKTLGVAIYEPIEQGPRRTLVHTDVGE